METADRKSTRLNSSHTVIYTLSLHDALPISASASLAASRPTRTASSPHPRPTRLSCANISMNGNGRSEEHTSELQSHSDLHSFPTRRSSDLGLGIPGRVKTDANGVVTAPATDEAFMREYIHEWKR